MNQEASTFANSVGLSIMLENEFQESSSIVATLYARLASQSFTDMIA